MTNNRKYNGGSAEAVRMHRILINARQANASQSGGESTPSAVPTPSPTTVALQGNNNAIPVYAPSGSQDQTTIMQIKNTQNQGKEWETTPPPVKGGGKKRKQPKCTKKRKTRQNKNSRKSRSRKSRSRKSRSRKSRSRK